MNNSAKIKKIAVSELKAKLLEYVRDVEKGKSFQITKDGKVVALLKPEGEFSMPIAGFAEGLIELKGDLYSPIPDVHNFQLPGNKRDEK